MTPEQEKLQAIYPCHNLKSLKPIPRASAYHIECQCGWSMTGDNDITLAIIHQSHLLDAHESERRRLDRRVDG